jgi:hypothetical protein
MKRVFLIVASISILAVSVLVAVSTSAVSEERILTDAQIEGIRGRCDQSKQEIERLRKADRLLRVNLGKQYEWIAKRLMAPLGSRIALNGLEGVELSATVVEYNRALAGFRENYLQYDRSIDDILGMNCNEQPIEYYTAIERTRELRRDTHESTKRLAELAKQYRAQIDDFAKNNSVDEVAQ